MKVAPEKIQRYEDLKRIAGPSPEDHGCLGQTLGRLRQWDSAKKELETALEMAFRRDGYEKFAANTRDPIIQFYLSQGRAEEALALYRRSLLIRPGDLQVQQKIRDLEASLGAEKQP